MITPRTIKGSTINVWVSRSTSFSTVFQFSERWAGDNERLCVMEPHLQSESSPPQAGIEPGTASRPAPVMIFLQALVVYPVVIILLNSIQYTYRE